MLLGCFGNGSEDLVRTGDVWDIDMDDAAPPVLWWRDRPYEEGEGDT